MHEAGEEDAIELESGVDVAHDFGNLEIIEAIGANTLGNDFDQLHLEIYLLDSGLEGLGLQDLFGRLEL